VFGNQEPQGHMCMIAGPGVDIRERSPSRSQGLVTLIGPGRGKTTDSTAHPRIATEHAIISQPEAAINGKFTWLSAHVTRVPA